MVTPRLGALDRVDVRLDMALLRLDVQLPRVRNYLIQVRPGVNVAFGDDVQFAVRPPAFERRPQPLQADGILPDHLAELHVVVRVHRGRDVLILRGALGRAQGMAGRPAQQPLHVLVLDQNLEVRHPVQSRAARTPPAAARYWVHHTSPSSLLTTNECCQVRGAPLPSVVANSACRLSATFWKLRARSRVRPHSEHGALRQYAIHPVCTPCGHSAFSSSPRRRSGL